MGFQAQTFVGDQSAVNTSVNSQNAEVQPEIAAPSQRRWWAEQRQFLLEDLYPMGSSPAPAPRMRRASQVGATGEVRNLGQEFGSDSAKKKRGSIMWSKRNSIDSLA